MSAIQGSGIAPVQGGGSGAVSSVFGRSGAVVAVTGDYKLAQITGHPGVYVTANAPTDGGDYTTIAAAITAVNAMSQKVPIYVLRSTTESVTITNSYTTILGFFPGQSNVIAWGSWTQGSATHITINGGLAGIEVGSMMLEELEFACATAGTTGCKIHDIGFNVNSTTQGLVFDAGGSFVSDITFDRCWWIVNTASANAITNNCTNAGLGQIFFNNCQFNMENTGQSIVYNASGATIGTNFSFIGGEMYQSSSASTLTIINTSGLIWGFEMIGMWFEFHASCTFVTIANVSTLHHLHITIANNSFGGTASDCTLISNTNAAGNWITEESAVQFLGNNFASNGAVMGAPGPASAYFRVVVRDNTGLFFTTGVLANYYDSTSSTFGIFGSSTSIPASTTLKVMGDLLVFLSCTTNIVIYDKNKTTQINGAETALTGRILHDGCWINFGSGTVTVTSISGGSLYSPNLVIS